MIAAEIAANRFGLGAVRQVQSGQNLISVRADLKQQLRDFDARPDGIAAVPDTAAFSRLASDHLDGLRAQGVIGDWPDDGIALSKREQSQRAAEWQREARKFFAKSARESYVQASEARIDAAVASKTPFAERLVHFWANHFAISVDKHAAMTFAGRHEFEAVRPNIMGKFSDLLKAASLHPAMLVYLDQTESVGPDSPVGQEVNARGRKRIVGLNENLAREILELHTLGVNGGYNQADVTAFANALTGWTVSGLARGPAGRSVKPDNSYGLPVFVQALHQPKPASVLGKSYAVSKEQQSLDILDDLARHPATARHIAGKLAQHFYGDNPPASLSDRLQADFQRSGGDLASLYGVLVDSPELWQMPATKFKSPWEWSISIMRAFPEEKPLGLKPLNQLRVMRNRPWWPGSPAGYGDSDNDWIAPDAIYKRVQLASQMAVRLRHLVNIEQIAQDLLPDSLSNTTRQEIQRAASPRQALALMLVSPEFMRR